MDLPVILKVQHKSKLELAHTRRSHHDKYNLYRDGCPYHKFHTLLLFLYGSSHWTQKHLNWVEKLQFENSIHQEVLREYLTVFYDLSEKVAVYDARIEELACFIWGMMTGNFSATALH